MRSSQRLATVLSALVALWAGLASAQDGGTTRYTRDADGRLETVTTSEGTTRYSYYPDGEIRSVDHSDGSREAYDHDEILAARKLAVRLRTEDAGDRSPRGSARGDPRPTTFTNPLDQSRNRFGFTGHYFDQETGLYYASARYYDPSIGRFTTADSNQGSIEDPPSLNRFVYAHDRPTYFLDPTGHETASAGCYWGPRSCGEHVPLTNPEKRGAGGFVGALRWGGKALWGTVNLALGRGWDGFGEKVVEAGQDPAKAVVEAKDQIKKHYNAELDAAQDSIARGDQFGAGARFSERVSSPAAAAVLGAGEVTAGAIRTGVRLAAGESVAGLRLKAPAPPVLDDVPVTETTTASKPFVATEEGRMRAASGGSQGADALLDSNAPPAAPLKPGRTPLREFDIDRYGTFSTSTRTGDQLAGHEMLQNAWLREHGYVGSRGAGAASRSNPAVALSEDLHGRVGLEQRKLGLFDRAKLKGMSAEDNIALNSEAMRNAGVPEDVVQTLKKEAAAHAAGLSK